MRRVLAFEWRRAVSLRSTWGFLLVGIGALLFVAWADNIFNPRPAGFTPSMEAIAAFGGAAPLGLVLITTICAQAFGHEYRDGTMRLVLSQFPRRPRVFLAKLAIPTAFLSVAVMLALAVAVLGANLLFGALPEDTWAGIVQISTRQVCLAIWWGLMVAGVTALIRNLAAGIVVSLVFAAVLENLALGLLTTTDPSTGQAGSRAPWLTENLPFTNAFTWAADGDPRSAAVAIVWALLVVGVAGVLFVRRDA